MAKTSDGKGGKLTLGWREWVALPELGVTAIRAKIDTGARTSSIHAWNIEPFELNGRPWLRFDVIPSAARHAKRISCEAAVRDARDIRNSGGLVERRYVIETALRMGDAVWRFELSLANRDEMGFRLLLGRTALADRVLVRPSASFLLGVPERGLRRTLSGLFSKTAEPSG